MLSIFFTKGPALVQLKAVLNNGNERMPRSLGFSILQFWDFRCIFEMSFSWILHEVWWQYYRKLPYCASMDLLHFQRKRGVLQNCSKRDTIYSIVHKEIEKIIISPKISGCILAFHILDYVIQEFEKVWKLNWFDFFSYENGFSV